MGEHTYHSLTRLQLNARISERSQDESSPEHMHVQVT